MKHDTFFVDVMNKMTFSKVRCSPIKQNFLSSTFLLPERRKLLSKNSLFQPNRETVLIFGGIDPHAEYGVGRNTGMDIFQYNADANSWSFVGEMPEPRHHHGAEFFKGRIYIVGGSDPRQDEINGINVVSTVWSFDPICRSWYHEMSLTEPRKNFGLVACAQGLYAIGGQGSKYQAMRTVEKYNAEKNCWEKMASLHRERTGHACVKFQNCIWVAGGLTGDNKKISVLDSVERYDIKKNQWTKISKPLRFPRCFARMFVLSDMLYVVGGAGRPTTSSSSSSSNDRTTTTTVSLGAVDVWDDKRSQWKYVTELNIPRHGHSVSYLGTQMLVIGGVTTIYSRALNNVECFCSQRGMWIRGLASLPTALSGHSALTLPPASLLTL